MKDKKILNNLVKGAGLTAFGMFFSKFVTYFYRVIVGRYIGPEAYGQLSLGLAVVGITTVFVKLGLDDAIKNFVPKARSRENLSELKGIVISSAQIISVSGIVLGSIVFLSAEFIATNLFRSPSTAPIIRVFAFVPFFSRLASVFIDTTLGHNTAKYWVITVQVLQNLIQLGVTVGMVFMTGMGVIGAAYGWFAGVLATVFIGFYFMEKNFGPIVFSDKKADYQHRKLLTYSYPLVLSGAVGTMLGWADTSLLGYYLNDAAVGFYNAALPTALLVTLPNSALGSLALPSLSELRENKGDAENALKTLARWGFALTFPTFLIMTLFASETLHLLFGKEYAVAGTALAILALGNLLGAAVGQLGGFLKSAGYTKTILYSNTASLVLNLIFNVLLIPSLGIIGAAIATASSTLLFVSLLIIQTYRREKIHPFHSKMLKTVLAGLVSFAATYLIFQQVFSPAPYYILIPAGVVFYGIYALVFLKIGGLTDYDREIIITTGRKMGLEEEVEKILDLLT